MWFLGSGAADGAAEQLRVSSKDISAAERSRGEGRWRNGVEKGNVSLSRE